MVSSADCRSAVSDCGGSIPSLPTTNLFAFISPRHTSRAHIAQSAEHFLGKEEVMGSNPIVSLAPIVYRLGRHSFKVESGVRLPVGAWSSEGVTRA